MKLTISAVAACLIGLSSQNIDLGPAYSVRMTGSGHWKEIKRYEKDPTFVEGLEFIDANHTTFIESVGEYWGSKLRKVRLSNEKAISEPGLEHELPHGVFGEGCTKFHDYIYQMTYREDKVFVYDATTLKVVKEMKMPKQMEEGWGLTHDETHLWASDGTDYIFKIKPDDFTVVEKVRVKDKQGKAIHYINELELVGDYIYGNVLPLNIIIKIDKKSGQVA